MSSHKRDAVGGPADEGAMDVIRLLRDLDPAAGVTTLDEAYFVRVESDMRRPRSFAARLRARRRGIFATGALSVVLLTIGIAAPAGAGIWYQAQNLRMNWDPAFGVASPSPGETVEESTEDVKGSTWIDPLSDDFDEWAVAALDLGLPVPDGMDEKVLAKTWADNFRGGVDANYGDDGGIVIQTATIQGDYASSIRCLWFDEWLASDGEDAKHPQSVLIDSLEWPDLSPKQRFGPVELAHLEDVRVWIETGDRAGIESEYNAWFCTSTIEDLVGKTKAGL